jgi:YidC/Oxa1 family membrane protein insertase
MENQRLFLVLALIFVLFLIWQAWVQEQALQAPPRSAPTATGAPTAPEGQAPQRQQDVPSITAAVGTAVESAPGRAQRIRVVTDVFEVEIATTGGDLRHVGLRTYSKSLEHRDQPFLLLQDSKAETFIAQSGLISDSGSAPNHYAQFVPEQTEYRLQEGQDSLEVPLTWAEAGLKVIKAYTFHRGSFVVDLSQRVENAGSQDWRGSQYRQMQRTPPEQSSGVLTGGIYTYTGGVISTPDKHYEKISFDAIAKKDLNLEVKGGWIAMIQHYFLAAWIPDQNEFNNFYTKALDNNRFVLGMVESNRQTISAGGSATFHSRLYVGPKIQDKLEEVAPYLNLTVDYGLLTVIAQPLFWMLKLIHRVIGNWGWAIIVLTILIKAAFFKLSETSYRSMANMRRLTPQFAKIKERYGDDKQKMNQALMEMYKKEKINPLGGCLPILVQIPVFIALYWVLLETVELRQAPFMLWIQDLSAKDPYFILPLIMGVTMFVQQKLNPPPPDPVQARVMMALPLVFTVFFLWFPSGLVLYWVVNNVLSIAQQYVITKRVEAVTAKV